MNAGKIDRRAMERNRLGKRALSRTRSGRGAGRVQVFGHLAHRSVKRGFRLEADETVFSRMSVMRTGGSPRRSPDGGARPSMSGD
jgi:hypothetical protein